MSGPLFAQPTTTRLRVTIIIPLTYRNAIGVSSFCCFCSNSVTLLAYSGVVALNILSPGGGRFEYRRTTDRQTDIEGPAQGDRIDYEQKGRRSRFCRFKAEETVCKRLRETIIKETTERIMRNVTYYCISIVGYFRIVCRI